MNHHAAALTCLLTFSDLHLTSHQSDIMVQYHNIISYYVQRATGNGQAWKSKRHSEEESNLDGRSDDEMRNNEKVRPHFHFLF